MLLLFAVLLLLQPQAQMAQDKIGQGALQPFVGTWKGVCADGKPFVLLTLSVAGSEATGTISIANMKGEEGQCVAVVDPPSPDHAMKITDAHVRAQTLVFKGSQGAQFDMTLVGSDGARLKFLDTPVEDTPWKLVRVN
jgi:hypothetical protein